MRNNLVKIGVLVLIAVGMMSLFAGASARRRQTNVNAECVSNVGKVATGFYMYVQDYDETFPIVTNGTQLENAILPYTRDASVFTCPATQLLYKPNIKWSGWSLAAIDKEPSSIWVVRDAKPHPDGYSTVGYLDGHVTRPGNDYQPDPNTECVDYVSKLTTSTLLYVQDYDEYLPPMKTSASFETATLPYVKGLRYFRCPATGLHYVPNAALSQTSLSLYPDPASVQVLQDAKPHADGLSTYSYLDGHVVRK